MQKTTPFSYFNLTFSLDILKDIKLIDLMKNIKKNVLNS